MDPSKLRRRWLPRRLSSARVMALALAGIGALTLLLLSKHSATPSSSSTSSSDVVLRGGRGEAAAFSTRALRTSTPASSKRIPYALPHPPTHKHTFLLLDAGSTPSPTLSTLRPHLEPLQQHPDAITVSTLLGPAALSLAAQFQLLPLDLPAAVYLPPMWETGGGFRGSATFPLAGPNATSPSRFYAWYKGHARVTLLLMNDWEGGEMCFYYVDEVGSREVELGCPATQSELWQEVGLLDRFVARNKTTRAFLQDHVSKYSGLFIVQPPHYCKYMLDPTCELPRDPFPTDATILGYMEKNQHDRKQAMQDQPNKFEHHHPVGFEKTIAPPALFETLSGYLNASWGHLQREVWHADDIFTNHYYAPSMKITIPQIGGMERRVVDTVRPLLESWIGGNKPLEYTAMYGIRVYSSNGTLSMHCDRPDTHIVSAIINVGQDVEEPWPLQIRDHSGKEHSVVMEPGQMVMYEGATCAHGREVPLKGRWFANVFVHFRPKAQAAAS